MGKYEFKIKRFRKKLEKSGFFEDVILDKSEFVLQEQDGGISGWIYYLKKYDKLEVKKFKDLFSQLDEVSFPITITWAEGDSRTVRFYFKDREGNEYYFFNMHYLKKNRLRTFLIGRRNSSIEPLVDRTYYYQILSDSYELDDYNQVIEKEDIELYKTSVVKLNEDGTNTDLSIEFSDNYYENSATRVTRKSKNKEILMEYPSKGAEFDKKVEDILFNINAGSNKNKWIYYNVKPLLKEMMEIMEKEDVSIYIGAKLDNEIYSEVTVANNVVQRYTYTEVVREDRMVRTTNIFSKKLKKFLR